MRGPARKAAPALLPSATSPNTGKALSAVEAERVVRGRSARFMGRFITTNVTTFGCQACFDTFPDPYKVAPNYHIAWEPPPGEGVKVKCEWCEKTSVVEK